MTKVLVLGGTSYVAQFLCARFLDGSLYSADNVTLTCTVRSSEPLDLPPGLELERRVHATTTNEKETTEPTATPRRVVHVFPGVTLLALETVRAVVDAYRPTVVINCVALSSPAACERDPATAHALNHPSELVAYLRTYATATPLHYLHFSTDFAYDGSVMGPTGYQEADAVATSSHCVYSATKLAFDTHLLMPRSDVSLLRVTVLRIANVVGGPAPLFPNQAPKFAHWLHRELLRSPATQSTPVRLWHDEVRSFLYVEDLVRVLWQLITTADHDERPVARVLNVGGVDAMSRVDFATQFVDEYTRLYPETTGHSRPIEAAARASVNLGYRSPLDARLDCSALRDAMPDVRFTQTSDMMRHLCRLLHDQA